jgi:hypothetical protein
LSEPHCGTAIYGLRVELKKDADGGFLVDSMSPGPYVSSVPANYNTLNYAQYLKGLTGWVG